MDTLLAKMFMRVTLLLCLLSMQTLQAQTLTGLAWSYEKAGKVGYLFGSVHFANSSFYPLPPKIMKAYNDSQVLVVEVDESLISVEEQQALIARYGQYPTGKKLSTELSPAAVTSLRKLLAEFDVPLSAVDSYRPGLLAASLTAMQASKLGYSAEQGLDRYFMQKARYKKKIRQIETFESQMALLAALPEEDLLLQQSFDNMQDYEQQWRDTMSAWKQGDGPALYRATIGSALEQYPELEPYFQVLFFDRHPKMLQVAEDCVIKDEGCFIVVGSGHLLGEQGLLNALEQKSYQIRQIK
ncbi:MAG: hypothetical protein C9356_08940 [Oleiphilus sp.]|nr:MAG: hypothetical protein C9356_08940 [Oleiphilus sp.]